MGMVRKTITLTQRKQALMVDIEAVRAALIEAEDSGEPKPFDSEAFKQRMRWG
ncbi:type II toxin-antitoxin system ParD family antitoxin [Asticcacaulis excentricus]|uniref:type II toxin-antitoxin system ParD family antitoxin n=1 Tax=Asticcacaulis excentricus TaxID=78587 RepID=UPI0001A793A1|nr:type II toxin-antitoxin system ParD family antitoxin [Asticcacaulis excentricus]